MLLRINDKLMKLAWQEQAENLSGSKKTERDTTRRCGDCRSANIYLARCHSDKLAHFWQKLGYYTILINRESYFRCIKDGQHFSEKYAIIKFKRPIKIGRYRLGVTFRMKLRKLKED